MHRNDRPEAPKLGFAGVLIWQGDSKLSKRVMTAANDVEMWHREVERGAEALDNAWRRADLRQSHVRRQREASELVQ